MKFHYDRLKEIISTGGRDGENEEPGRNEGRETGVSFIALLPGRRKIGVVRGKKKQGGGEKKAVGRWGGAGECAV